MAYGNQLSMTVPEKLNRVKGWQNKGLAYWERRVVECERSRREADSYTKAARFSEQLAIARLAIKEIEGGMSAALGPRGK